MPNPLLDVFRVRFQSRRRADELQLDIADQTWLAGGGMDKADATSAADRAAGLGANKMGNGVEDDLNSSAVLVVDRQTGKLIHVGGMEAKEGADATPIALPQDVVAMLLDFDRSMRESLTQKQPEEARAKIVGVLNRYQEWREAYPVLMPKRQTHDSAPQPVAALTGAISCATMDAKGMH